MSEGVNEVNEVSEVSEGMNEGAHWSVRAKQAGRSKQTSEQCEPTREIWVLVYFIP